MAGVLALAPGAFDVRGRLRRFYGGRSQASRVIILFKSYLYELKQLILPTRVKRIWFEGKAVSDQTVRSVLVYFFTYLAIIGIGTLLIALDEHDLVTNLTASVACMSNIGPGLNLVGPSGISPSSQYSASWC